jgi:hypothetical protein
VADHLLLGAERGDEQAVAWLRDAAREASAQAPLVAVELLRRAEALLPCGHRDADLVSSEVVQALLRAGQVAEASARAEAVLARQHAAEVDIPLRLALVGALALQNRAAELITVAQASLAGPARLRPSEQVMMVAQQSWALVYTGDPRAGESAASRALVIAERAGDTAMTVWALTALMVAVGRQGRYGEALAHARRAAARAADSPDMRMLLLQPKYFLGLALFDCDLVGEARAAFREALDDEFGSGWWLSETLMADVQASFAVGEWEDAVPGLIAGGQAAAAWRVRYAAGVRPRKAASRSLGSAVAPAVTGAANRGCRPVRGTSTGAITSRPVARARGIGWRCPHARDMSHPWTATSRAAVAAMTLAASGQPAISMTWRWWPGLVQASRSWQARSRNARAGSAARSPSSAAGSRPTRPASMPSPNAARDSLACLSSIRRSHSGHGVGRDRSSGVTARTTPRA